MNNSIQPEGKGDPKRSQKGNVLQPETQRGLAAIRQQIANLEFLEKELVRVAQDLRASQERYRVLVEEVNDIVYTVDRNKTVTYIGPVIEEVGGYTPAEVVGRSFLDFVFEPDVARVDAQFQDNISARQEMIQFRFRVVTKAGEVRWARTYSRPIFAGAQVVGLRGVMTDVTEWVGMERERERLIHELQTALEQVKTLKGLLPICASCKKIQDDQGDWVRLEEYLQKHTDARLTHDLCPDCATELYPDHFQTG